MPEALWFEGFETETVSIFEKGALHGAAPCPPGGHAWKLGPHGDATWKETVEVKLNSTPLKIPGGIDPRAITMHFQVWTEEPGIMLVWFNHAAGEYNEQKTIGIAKAWTSVELKFTDLGGKKRPEADQVCTLLRFFYRSKTKGAAPPTYIDNILITAGAAPMDLLARALERERKMVSLRRRPEKDGFNYSLTGQELLMGEMRKAKSRRKERSVLIAGPGGMEAGELKKQLDAAAKKLNATGYNFDVMKDPSGSPVSGLEDSRALISSALLENDAQVALIVLGAADLLAPRAPDGVQALIARAIAAGAAPLVCVPAIRPGMAGAEKLTAASTAVIDLCNKHGVPWADQNFAVKNVATAFNGDELGAAGLECAAGLAMAALKHACEGMKRRGEY